MRLDWPRLFPHSQAARRAIRVISDPSPDAGCSYEGNQVAKCQFPPWFRERLDLESCYWAGDAQ